MGVNLSTVNLSTRAIKRRTVVSFISTNLTISILEFILRSL